MFARLLIGFSGAGFRRHQSEYYNPEQCQHYLWNVSHLEFFCVLTGTRTLTGAEPLAVKATRASKAPTSKNVVI
jgi:hypothetical protein